MKMLVSIHDVSPAWTPATLLLWNLCEAQGCTPALFVVPNWHGSWPLEKHPNFVRWLQHCADRGAELFLHGERHDELGVKRNTADELRAFGRTNREGEFLTLGRDQAAERIARGASLLRSLDLNPIGFVPPAWLARDETFEAANDVGLPIGEDEHGVRIFPRRARIKAPAIRWSGRTTFRAHMSAAIASARWHTQRRQKLMRLALHPQDFEHPKTADSVVKEMRRWLTPETNCTYAEL